MSTSQVPTSLAQNYLAASSIGEALAYLSAHRGEAQLVAGGTDLWPRVQSGDLVVDRLVHVSHISAMKKISRENGYLVLGGAVTFATLQQDEMVREWAPLLWSAAQQMGTSEVRSLATLAGNVVTALGNADGAVALVALDAEAEITNLTGSQWLPVETLFVRNGVSRVDSSSEIVTSIRFNSLRHNQGMALERIPPPNPGERSPLVLAIALSLEQDGKAVEWASVATGAADSVPLRFLELEELLGGLRLDDVRAREMLPVLVYDSVVASGLFNGTLPSHADVVALGRRAFRHALAAALGEGESMSGSSH